MITSNQLKVRTEQKTGGNPARCYTLEIGVWSLLIYSVMTIAPAEALDDGSYDVSSKVASSQANQQSVPLESRRTTQGTIMDEELDEAITRNAQENRLPSALLKAVIKAESGFNPLVISKAGAVGLMQLIPETAIQHGVYNLYDTRDNIAGGAKHLRYLVDRYHGNVRLALAAYNAGARHVDRYRQIPPFKETQTYVKKVIGFYRDYRMTRFAPFSSRLLAGPTYVKMRAMRME